MGLALRRRRSGRLALSSPGPDYWLCRCEGFRVDAHGKRLGVVEEVRYASRLDRPDWIAIRTGLFARGVRLVPVAEVASIDVDRGLILLTAG